MKYLLLVLLGLMTSGCMKSDEDKMQSVCRAVIGMMVVDPSALTVNSISIVSAAPAERNLRRLAELKGRDGKLSGDQEAALEVLISGRERLKEAYVTVDYTSRSGLVSGRDKAVCWYMDTGQGFELASVSAMGRNLSGFQLLSFFVENGRPEHLSRSQIIE